MRSLARGVLGGALAYAMSMGHVADATASPPSPHVSVEDGLEISRAAANTSEGGTFTRREDGGYDYVDHERRFRAQILANGRVKFVEERQIRNIGVCRNARCVPFHDMGRYLTDPKRWLMHLRRTTNEMGRDIDNPELAASLVTLGVGYRFGRSQLTDRLKADFLRDSLDLRLSLAGKAERSRIAAALASVETRLQAIWAAKHVPLDRRRELLFQLWDDSIDVALAAGPKHDDDVSLTLDKLRARAAAEARSRVIGFIRDALPAASDGAYTDEELRRFNARRVSHEVFAPYPDAT